MGGSEISFSGIEECWCSAMGGTVMDYSSMTYPHGFPLNDVWSSDE